MMKRIIDNLGVKIGALELEAKISVTKLKDKDTLLKKYKDMLLKKQDTRQNLPQKLKKMNTVTQIRSGSPVPRHRFESKKLVKPRPNNVQTQTPSNFFNFNTYNSFMANHGINLKQI